MSSSLSWCAGGDTDEENAGSDRTIQMEDLPDMPKRGPAYWTEPFMGVCVVGVLSTILIALTYGATTGASEEDPPSSLDSSCDCQGMAIALVDWAWEVLASETGFLAAELGKPSHVSSLGQVALALIWAEAGVAALSTLFLLFGNAGELSRSPETCYPIPAEVEHLLKQWPATA
eukprot:s5316_g2.t1